ncbi:hypothetical protein QWY82_01565 [Simiduia curdlanivorans]|uniref:MFS transporter n=1 Tax=Simiduia curdlanivorans TaxID=1492769 RepID=A0ABV8V3M0_9GAMM|nr:MFS transporter [Simiduia curdlanivorans]MDN3637484.1 hypothetical protein [Simiduia curdlanivorans]
MFDLSAVKKLEPNSPLTYLGLALVAMSGLSYINYLPSLVAALAGGMGFNDVQAGQIVALNGYGGLFGSMLAILWVRRIHWRSAMMILLPLLAAVDLSTAWLTESYIAILIWRFIAGALGGLCVGIGFAALVRLPNTDRAYGTLLFVQFCLGSLVIYFFPELERASGAHSIFFVMASLLLLGLAYLAWLPELVHPDKIQNIVPSQQHNIRHKQLLMLALVCYQLAASAIWAYVGLIGGNANFSDDQISSYIASTGLLGLIGAMLPIIAGNRLNRLRWLATGILLSIIAALILTRSPLTTTVYAIAMALLFIAWPAVLAFLLAVIAEMDSSGRLATIAWLISSIGMASGPMMAATLLQKGDFTLMLYACAGCFALSLTALTIPVQVCETAKSRLQTT